MTTKDLQHEHLDRLAVLQVIQEWAFFRDGGDWISLRRSFSLDGKMTTNGGTATADEFINYARGLREKGVLSHHFIGPSLIQLKGDKALVETQANLMVRSKVGAVDVDVWCLLRYLDRVVRSGVAWTIQDRRPIYIKDRMDPVVPGSSITVDPKMLAEGPEGCRYLVYLGRASGAPHNPIERATFNTPYATDLYAAGQKWLAS
jgi:SnoaL-like domain